MGEPAVVFDGVWKKFRRGERHDSLRDLIPSTAKALFGRLPKEEVLREQEFWALQDVSFELGAGEALGIIGPNGAGKSTTLKLLTRILKPTLGSCRLRGRVGALIEVAAGFHPDLTGRENVYLQGAIMGMRRAEIARKFDEIVEFSGVGDFIDTQVKRYSSGMNARLGFAIAAHLDADVLLIDEVLSVGDFSFQQRAFDRLTDVVKGGTPTVVVSHQLDRVASLCNQAVLLQGGRVARMGTPSECIAAYASNQAPAGAPAGACAIELESVTIGSPDPVQSGGRTRITVAGRRDDSRFDPGLTVTLRIRSVQTGQVVFATSTWRHRLRIEPGPFELHVDIQANVQPGDYMVESLVSDARMSKELRHGPVAYLPVSEGTSFYGTVQMNARLALIPPGSPADR